MLGRRLWVSGVPVLLLLSLVGSPPAGALGAVAPVQGLTLRGTTTPQEVVAAWTVVDRSAYGGARLVVTPGDLMPSGPDEPRAVAIIDVPASALTAAWTASAAGATFTISVFARDSAGAYAPPTSGRVTVPGVVRHLVVGSYRGAWAEGAWVLPPGADAAIICYAQAGAPAAPTSATTCSPAARYQARVDTPGAFGTFATSQFAAFAVAAGTGVLGARSLVVGETAPPFPAHRLTSVGAGKRYVRFEWDNGYQEPGGALHGLGGTVTWLVYRAVGTASPAVAGSDGVTEVPPGTDYRVVAAVDGLARDTTYTFAIRGRDVEGNLSDWSEPLTTATRQPGLSVVSDARRDGRWRSSRVPGTRDTWSASVAALRGGGVVVGAATGNGSRPGGLIATRTAAGTWRAREIARAGYRHLTVDPHTGTLFAASFECIHRKRPGAGWRTLWCADGRVNDGVHSLVLDGSGRVHALVDTLAGTSYVTNAGGSWRVVPAPDLSGTLNLPVLRYDRASRTLVLLSLTAGTPDLRIATKRPRQARFGPWRSWYRPADPDHGFVISSAAADDGRVVVAVTTRRADGLVWGQPRLVSGQVTGHGVARAIRGTNIDSAEPVVAVRGRRLQVAWTWATDLPGHPAQGVWSSAGRWNGERGHWALARPGRRSVSAYDRVMDVEVTPDGAGVLLVWTVAQEWDRLRAG